MSKKKTVRVIVQIRQGDDFNTKVVEFMRRSNGVLEHPTKKPFKIKKSFLKKHPELQPALK